MRLDLTTFIFIGGMLHFCILSAGVLLPLVLRWRSELLKIDATSRHVIWVHGAFVMLTIVAFGLVGTVYAPVLAAGASGLARAVCGFIAVFWLARLVMQFALFDPGPKLLRNPVLKLGYHGLTIVFLYFALTFGYAALRPL